MPLQSKAYVRLESKAQVNVEEKRSTVSPRPPRLQRLQCLMKLPFGSSPVAWHFDRLVRVNSSPPSASDWLQSLQSGHPGSKAFKGSLTLFTFIADVATGPVRCPPSATQNFADAKFRRASSGHRHCPRFYSPFSCVQGQRVGATGAGQGRCPRP